MGGPGPCGLPRATVYRGTSHHVLGYIRDAAVRKSKGQTPRNDPAPVAETSNRRFVAPDLPIVVARRPVAEVGDRAGPTITKIRPHGFAKTRSCKTLPAEVFDPRSLTTPLVFTVVQSLLSFHSRPSDIPPLSLARAHSHRPVVSRKDRSRRPAPSTSPPRPIQQASPSTPQTRSPHRPSNVVVSLSFPPPAMGWLVYIYMHMSNTLPPQGTASCWPSGRCSRRA
jgi:hypothetical protein